MVTYVLLQSERANKYKVEGKQGKKSSSSLSQLPAPFLRRSLATAFL